MCFSLGVLFEIWGSILFEDLTNNVEWEKRMDDEISALKTNEPSGLRV